MGHVPVLLRGGYALVGQPLHFAAHLQPPSNGGSAEDAEGGNGASGSGAGPRLLYAKLGKDPTVRTDFLPDKDREREEQELREKLKVGGLERWGVGWQVA